MVSLLLVAVIVAALHGDAHACKLLGPIAHVVDPSLQETDHTSPTLVINQLPLIDYGDSSGGCGSDCADVGSIRIPLIASDDMTAPERIGYRFTLEAGELPPGLTLPDAAVETNAPGAVDFYWNGSTGRPSTSRCRSSRSISRATRARPSRELVLSHTNYACAVARRTRHHRV